MPWFFIAIMKIHRQHYSYLLLFAVAMCWGIHPSISKLAMSIHDNAYLIVLIQNIMILLCILATNCYQRLDNLFNKKHIRPALYGSLLNYGIAIPMMTLTTKHLLISHILLLVGLTPLFTYFIALLWKHSNISIKRFLGTIITFCALAILFFNEIFTHYSINKWYLIILLTPLAFALQNNIIKSWARHQLDVIGLVFYQNLFATCFITILLVMLGEFQNMSPIILNVNFLYLTMILALLHLGGQLFFYQLLKIANIVFSSQASNLSIIVGVLWAIFIGNEMVSATFIIAMLTMLYGVYLTQNK